MREFTIIYPNYRNVSEQTIRTWYSDAVANGECDALTEDIDNVDAMATVLDDAGCITLTSNA